MSAEHGASHGRERLSLDVVRAFALAVAKAEPHTGAHHAETARFAVRLARRLRLGQATTRLVRMGAQLHDLGKIGVPGSILLQPRRLSQSEFAVIREHPRIGWEIMSQIGSAGPLATVILQHHEHLDGTGYPGGLGGGDIMDESLVVATADITQALVSRRSYQSEAGLGWIVRTLDSASGSHLPPRYVDAAIDLMRSDMAAS